MGETRTDKIADFVYYLNRTDLNRVDPTVKDGVLVGLWDAGKVTAKLQVNYRTEVRLSITYPEILHADPEALALEVAENIVSIYKERLSMPLLESK